MSFSPKGKDLWVTRFWWFAAGSRADCRLLTTFLLRFDQGIRLTAERREMPCLNGQGKDRLVL